MTYIDFNVNKWKAENPDSKLEDLIQAIEGADPVFCGWVIQDAETVRKDQYPDRNDLTIDDSRIVMFDAASKSDNNLGFGWDDLYNAYTTYVTELDKNPAPTEVEKTHPMFKYLT